MTDEGGAFVSISVNVKWLNILVDVSIKALRRVAIVGVYVYISLIDVGGGQ